MSKIYLATLQKQQEIIDKLDKSGGGEINYLYTLASFDSTAMPTEIEALKGLKNIKSIANSEVAMTAVANSSTAIEAVANSSTAMEAVANSSTAMKAVINSSTAMRALLGSKNTKALKGEEISGRFLPLKAGSDDNRYQAYNGIWSNVGTALGAWLKANPSNPIATKIKAASTYNIHYYDLDA